MDYITITTPENIEIKYRLAGVGSRLAASVIDMFLVILAIIIVNVTLIFLILDENFYNLLNFNLSGWVVAFIIISTFIIYFGYFIISELTMKGQSLGKKLFKLRVIRENGQPVGFVQSLIRNLFKYFIDFFGFGVICIFFSKKCRRFGDMAASTIVIAEDSALLDTQSLTLDSLIKDETAIIENDKYSISNEEYYLLKEYFSRKNNFIDDGLKVRLSLAQYFAYKFSIDSQILDDNVLYKLMQVNKK